jgi:hypothetical protein
MRHGLARLILRLRWLPEARLRLTKARLLGRELLTEQSS